MTPDRDIGSVVTGGLFSCAAGDLASGAVMSSAYRAKFASWRELGNSYARCSEVTKDRLACYATRVESR